MTMITPSYLGETIEYSSLHACRSTLEDPTSVPSPSVIEISEASSDSAKEDNVLGRFVVYQLIRYSRGGMSGGLKLGPSPGYPVPCPGVRESIVATSHIGAAKKHDGLGCRHIRHIRPGPCRWRYGRELLRPIGPIPSPGVAERCSSAERGSGRPSKENNITGRPIERYCGALTRRRRSGWGLPEPRPLPDPSVAINRRTIGAAKEHRGLGGPIIREARTAPSGWRPYLSPTDSLSFQRASACHHLSSDEEQQHRCEYVQSRFGFRRQGKQIFRP